MSNARREVTYPSTHPKKKKHKGFVMPTDAELEAQGLVKYEIEGTTCHGWCKPEDLWQYKSEVEDKFQKRALTKTRRQIVNGSYAAMIERKGVVE